MYVVLDYLNIFHVLDRVVYLSTCLPTLSCHDLPCPALSWIALFVLYIFFFLPCPVLSLALSCLALPCPVLDWGCLACCVILSFLPCLALPCLVSD